LDERLSSRPVRAAAKPKTNPVMRRGSARLCDERWEREASAERVFNMTLTIVKDATCTFCGCVCDDIELHADGNRIVKAKNACSLGESWFKHHTAERLFPDALVDGRPVTLDDAIEAAAECLNQANMPLVYGLSNVTCEAQREAVALAEMIGGVVDSHTSL
jgi:formylmethanofuran dehydrogenase subunit B